MISLENYEVWDSERVENPKFCSVTPPDVPKHEDIDLKLGG